MTNQISPGFSIHDVRDDDVTARVHRAGIARGESGRISIAVVMIPLALMINVGLGPLVITTFEFQSMMWFVLGLPALPVMLLSMAALYSASEPRLFWELLGFSKIRRRDRLQGRVARYPRSGVDRDALVGLDRCVERSAGAPQGYRGADPDEDARSWCG